MSEFYNAMTELYKQIQINRAILSQVHGISDLDEYIDLYYPHYELVPNKFALNLYWSEIDYQEMHKYYYRKGGMEIEEFGYYDFDTEVKTQGNNWEYTGDINLLDDQLYNGYRDINSPAYLYEEQQDLEFEFDRQTAWRNQTGIFSPEIPTNLPIFL